MKHALSILSVLFSIHKTEAKCAYEVSNDADSGDAVIICGPTEVPSFQPTMKPSSNPSLSNQPTIFPSSYPSLRQTQALPILMQNQCNITPADRRQLLRNIIEPILSPTSDLDDIGSPAYLAFEWLVEEDGHHVCPAELESKIIQRFVVAKLYFEQEGETWFECSSPEYSYYSNPTCNPTIQNDDGHLDGTPWLDSAHECDWAFLTCDEDQCITKIEVDENNVGGNLIDEIDWLPMVEVFTMDGYANHIVSTIPTQFGNLTHLKILDLDRNSLTGTIPEELYAAKGLIEFDLNENKLTGTISTLIGTLTDLEFLQLFGNRLSGTIPEVIGNLSSLYDLSLHFNSLEGYIGKKICSLPSLDHVTADCVGGKNAKVNCKCCNVCY